MGLVLQLGLAQRALQGGAHAWRESRGWGALGIVLGAFAGLVQLLLIVAMVAGVPDLFG